MISPATAASSAAPYPHVHCLVTGGGISEDGRDWYPARDAFLLPYQALADRVRGKFRALLASKRPDLIAPYNPAWTTSWVVHIARWGQGAQAVLDYLARYVFRIAITNARLVALDHHTVTIRYKHRKSSRWRTCRMEGSEFMRRFLQHVLPKGLHKVRYFGLWHPAKRAQAAQARLLLELDRTKPAPSQDNQTAERKADQPALSEPRICPCCRHGQLIYVRRLTPKNALGP